MLGCGGGSGSLMVRQRSCASGRAPAVVVAGGRSATADNATAVWSLTRGKQFILYLLMINR